MARSKFDLPPRTLPNGKRNPAYTKAYEALPHRRAAKKQYESSDECRVARANREGGEQYADRITKQLDFIKDTSEDNDFADEEYINSI